MSDIDQLIAIGHELDAVDPGANPDKARALLRRRRELRHKTEQARDRAVKYQARERDQRTTN